MFQAVHFGSSVGTQSHGGLVQMSSVENPGWLFDIGDYTTQLYGDYFISQYKDPVINQPG